MTAPSVPRYYGDGCSRDTRLAGAGVLTVVTCPISFSISKCKIFLISSPKPLLLQFASKALWTGTSAMTSCCCCCSVLPSSSQVSCLMGFHAGRLKHHLLCSTGCRDQPPWRWAAAIAESSGTCPATSTWKTMRRTSSQIRSCPVLGAHEELELFGERCLLDRRRNWSDPCCGQGKGLH